MDRLIPSAFLLFLAVNSNWAFAQSKAKTSPGLGTEGARVEEPAKRAEAFRALNRPVAAIKSAKATKPVVFIYYANETAPNAEEALNIARISQWLRSTNHPEISLQADNIELDTVNFPSAVDDDIRAIKDGHLKAKTKRPAVVIFTNRLATQGRLEYALSDNPGEFKIGEFELPSTRAGLYEPYPLASTEAFEAALKTTAELFNPESHEFVLVTKSHGSPSHPVITHYQHLTRPETGKQFAKTVKDRYLSSLAKKLEDAHPLATSESRNITDKAGNGLLEKEGLLYWESFGRVAVANEDKTLFLADRSGNPFLTSDNRRILIDGKHLKIEGQKDNVRDTLGQSIELIGLLLRNTASLTSDEADELPKSRLPLPMPLVRCATVDRAIIQNAAMVIPIEGGGILRMPIMKLEELVETSSNGLHWREQVSNFAKIANQTNLPVLNADQIIVPLVPVGKKVPALLAIDKWVGDSRLGDADTTLGPEGDTTLNMEDNTTLGPEGDTTLSIDDNSTLSINDPTLLGVEERASLNTETAERRRVFGISKSQYMRRLLSSAKSGIYFRLVFLEACQSELPANLIKRTGTTAPKSNVAQIWTSDARGLKYGTIDYSNVFEVLPEAGSFSEALRVTLQRKFDEEELARAEALR